MQIRNRHVLINMLLIIVVALMSSSYPSLYHQEFNLSQLILVRIKLWD